MRATYVAAAPWITAFSYQYRERRVSRQLSYQSETHTLSSGIADDTATSLTVPPIMIKFKSEDTDAK